MNRFLCILFALFTSAEMVFAEIVYLTPSADTSLLEAFPENNFGGQAFFNSGTTQNNTKNRGLLKFDIAGQLPANAKIKSSSLILEVTRSPSDGDTPSTFELRRMLRDWGEGNKSGEPPLLGAAATTNEANWYYRFAFTTNTWGVPGGQSLIDFSAISSGEQYFYGPNFSPYTIDSSPHWNPNMIEDIQGWLSQPAYNFGWMLLSQSEDFNFTARRFGSREDSGRAAILMIEYFILRIDEIKVVGNSIELKFFAEAEQAYAVKYKNALGDGSWLTLTNISSSPEATHHVVKDSLNNTSRHYRLVLP